MNARTLFLSAALLSIAPLATADSAFDVGLSDDSVRVGYGSFWERHELHFGANWLHHEDDGDVVDVGLHALGVVGQGKSELDLGIGGRVFWVDIANRSGQALGLGVVAAYTIPPVPRLRLAGTLHYAPDIVAFSDLEKYYEASLSVSFLVVDRAQIYVGYRVAKAEVEGVAGRLEVDDGGHVGIRIEF